MNPSSLEQTLDQIFTDFRSYISYTYNEQSLSSVIFLWKKSAVTLSRLLKLLFPKKCALSSSFTLTLIYLTAHKKLPSYNVFIKFRGFQFWRISTDLLLNVNIQCLAAAFQITAFCTLLYAYWTSLKSAQKTITPKHLLKSSNFMPWTSYTKTNMQLTAPNGSNYTPNTKWGF